MIELKTNEVEVFADTSNINATTGLAAGGAFNSPDSPAIDANGNICMVEDKPGGTANIWLVKHADKNGMGESVSAWATLRKNVAEPTGLYFDALNPNIACVDVQHPDSGNDFLMQSVAAPEPESRSMMVCGPGLVGFALRKRQRLEQAKRLRFA